MIAKAFGFTVDFLSEGNTHCIVKLREFAVDSKGKRAYVRFMNSPG